MDAIDYMNHTIQKNGATFLNNICKLPSSFTIISFKFHAPAASPTNFSSAPKKSACGTSCHLLPKWFQQNLDTRSSHLLAGWPRTRFGKYSQLSSSTSCGCQNAARLCHDVSGKFLSRPTNFHCVSANRVLHNFTLPNLNAS